VSRGVVAVTPGPQAVWIPHSHRACSQHAPDEPLAASIARQAPEPMPGPIRDPGDAAARLPHR